MMKRQRLNIRFTRDEYVALKARAEAIGQSPHDRIRTLINHDLKASDWSIFDALDYEIVSTAVDTHHLITLTGDRNDLPKLMAEVKRTAKVLGVHYVDQ